MAHGHGIMGLGGQSLFMRSAGGRMDLRMRMEVLFR